MPGDVSQTPHLNKTTREVCEGHGKTKGLPEGRKMIRLKSETLPCNFLMPTVGMWDLCFSSHCSTAPPPQWAWASSFTRFLDHTQRRATVGRTPLDELSACRRDLYLTTHDTHNRQTSMPPMGLEPTMRAAADLHLRMRGHWDRLESFIGMAVSLLLQGVSETSSEFTPLTQTLSACHTQYRILTFE